jgi:hypothetical protein
MRLRAGTGVLLAASLGCHSQPLAEMPRTEPALPPPLHLPAGVQSLRISGEDFTEGFRPLAIRSSVVLRPLDIESIPVVTVPAPLRGPPRGRAAQPRATEIDVTHDASSPEDARELRLKLAPQSIGALTVEGTTEGSSNALTINCGPNGPTVPARWRVLERGSGGIRYTITDAWFDAATCSATVARRTVIPVEEILVGLLFAFRECYSSCGERQVLHFVGPANTVDTTDSDRVALEVMPPFLEVRMTLDGPIAASFIAGMGWSGMEAWFGHPPGWATFDSCILFGVDVSQTLVEDAPVGIAYRARELVLEPSREATVLERPPRSRPTRFGCR